MFRLKNVLFITVTLMLATTGLFAAESAQTQSSYFQKFFIDGGLLVWLVLLPLSALAIQLVIKNCLAIRRNHLIPQEVIDTTNRHIEQDNTLAAVDFLKEQKNFMGLTLHAGLAESFHGRAAMENAMAEMIEQQTTHYLRKIEWLNIIGNVAPMIGLFGTVWGMINAFNGIVIAGGQPEPVDLADGISVALVTTWWGLVVAIPSLAAYGFLRNRIDTLAADTAVESEEILRNIQTFK